MMSVAPQNDLIAKRLASIGRRRWLNRAMMVVAGMVAAAILGMLAWILIETTVRGLAAFNWAFFTELPVPPGEAGGGLANAMVGTLLMTIVAVVIGVPIGLGTGIYLAEFAHGSRLAGFIRYLANILISSPSIIIGLFVYEIIVVPTGGFSGWAGGISLAILIIPIVARTTEDMLLLVPRELRESSLALGATRSRTILSVVFRSARNGLLSAILLAVARVSGETAPLLFTALNNPFWGPLNEPTGNLTVTIFNYAMSPYDDWQQKAWGASLLITVAILWVTVFSRFILRERKPGSRRLRKELS